MNDGNNFSDNEMWAAENSTYWVEAGYTSEYGLIHYFWAQVDRNGIYQQGILSQVPSGDYGNNVRVTLQNIPNGWSQSLSSPNYAFNRFSYVSLNVNQMKIGTELSGTQSASDPQTWWRNNQWLDTSGTWHFQDTLANVTYQLRVLLAVDGSLHHNQGRMEGFGLHGILNLGFVKKQLPDLVDGRFSARANGVVPLWTGRMRLQVQGGQLFVADFEAGGIVIGDHVRLHR